MIFRAPLFVLVAVLALAACNAEGGLPDAANVDNLRERPTAEQALYLAAYEIGQQARQQDTTFNVDAFLRGFHDAFEADSATAFPYAIGYQQGLELAAQARTDSTISSDVSLYVAGFREGFEDRERRLTPDEERRISEEMQLAQIRREAGQNPQAQAFLDELDATAARADSFLTANAARDSVQTTESGVQYIIQEAGSGDRPEDDDRVMVIYTGSLADGFEFDSSQGQPVDFVVSEMIPGFAEMLKGMQIGERRRIFIPPSLGYGMQGQPRGGIGPNSVLVFDLRLVDILDPVAEGTQAPGLSQPQIVPGQ